MRMAVASSATPASPSPERERGRGEGLAVSKKGSEMPSPRSGEGGPTEGGGGGGGGRGGHFWQACPARCARGTQPPPCPPHPIRPCCARPPSPLRGEGFRARSAAAMSRRVPQITIERQRRASD